MDRVIKCPGDVHKEARLDKTTNTYITTPRILMIIGEDTSGEFQVQCHDSACKKHGYNRGWYRIKVTNGKITINPVINKRFELEQYPVAIIDA
jgi:hypothetical protein